MNHGRLQVISPCSSLEEASRRGKNRKPSWGNSESKIILIAILKHSFPEKMKKFLVWKHRHTENVLQRIKSSCPLRKRKINFRVALHKVENIAFLHHKTLARCMRFISFAKILFFRNNIAFYVTLQFFAHVTCEKGAKMRCAGAEYPTKWNTFTGLQSGETWVF